MVPDRPHRRAADGGGGLRGSAPAFGSPEVFVEHEKLKLLIKETPHQSKDQAGLLTLRPSAPQPVP